MPISIVRRQHSVGGCCLQGEIAGPYAVSKCPGYRRGHWNWSRNGRDVPKVHEEPAVSIGISWETIAVIIIALVNGTKRKGIGAIKGVIDIGATGVDADAVTIACRELQWCS